MVRVDFGVSFGRVDFGVSSCVWVTVATLDATTGLVVVVTGNGGSGLPLIGAGAGAAMASLVSGLVSGAMFARFSR